jgi:transcriptional regulator GlxA family with amidase domain
MSPASCDPIAGSNPGPSTIATHGNFTAILVKLLDGAGGAIYRDRDAALACIARASDGASREHGSVTPARGGLAPWQVLRVKTHVEVHLDSSIRMRDLAAIARLSTGHFTRSFKRSFGVAPLAYLTRRRLARAQDMMLTTTDPLCQIALACGLYDQSHLTRMFRRHVGIPPNDWRRRHSCRAASQSVPGLKVASGSLITAAPASPGHQGSPSGAGR